jgi:hypothetical protein
VQGPFAAREGQKEQKNSKIEEGLHEELPKNAVITEAYGLGRAGAPARFEGCNVAMCDISLEAMARPSG